MKLVIFGLTISSSWGNGHATLWRGLCRALAGHGHTVVFFERDVPYYSDHRDLTEIQGTKLCLYPEWEDVSDRARQQLAEADVVMVTSYCPDGIAASELALMSPAQLKVFYDLDTPVTLENLRQGKTIKYLGPRGLRDFDLVLSYTGGAALEALRTTLGARRVSPLYGSVDPDVHRPVEDVPAYRADISYLGTYAEDRQSSLETFFIEPARRLADRRFMLAGAQYPQDFPWRENIHFVRHLPPGEHPAFYCSSRLTLNLTRQAMTAMGYCPSGRLFEASACGAPILSDAWEGLDEFFEPGSEIIVAKQTEDAIDALQLSDERLRAIAKAAHERTLAEHTAEHRAQEMEAALEAAVHPTGETELTDV